MGTVWTSRLLQGTLSIMLDDVGVAAQVATAAQEYRGRRAALASELERFDIVTQGTEGFSLWVPVQDEHAALRMLRAHRISAAAGSSFIHLPTDQHHVRIATTQLPIHLAGEVGAAVAEAAAMPRSFTITR